MQLKDRFFEAVISGQLGEADENGVAINRRDFMAYFSDIKTDYKSSFLPAATIEPGRTTLTHTKFLYRIGYGLYRIHPDAIPHMKKYDHSQPGEDWTLLPQNHTIPGK